MGYMYQNDMQLAAMTRSMQEAAMKCVEGKTTIDYEAVLYMRDFELAELREENRRLRMRINLLKGGRIGDGSGL